jgi:hypothetical protein
MSGNNGDGVMFYVLDKFTVATFQSNGSKKPDQVHLVLDFGHGIVIVMRLKSKDVCQELIKALVNHSKEVWGG